MLFEPTECNAISGGEYAARLLGVNNPNRLVDHLIEHLSPKTGGGHESALLEFKATYHPSPEFPDDSDQDEFEWNVMKSFIALANAQGGCVLIGLEEDNDTHEIKRGDWDPDQILSTYHEDGTRIQRDGQEEKDLINHVRKIFFSDRARRNGKRYQFVERQSGRDPSPRAISIDGTSVTQLASLVEIYPCHSETYSCNVLAAVVRPVGKGGDLVLVQITGRPETLFYRDSTAQTIPLTGHQQIRRYEDEREPESPDFALQLHTPHIALRAKATVFSNIPPPDPNFIGREGELARLHDLCLLGKMPLIHAAGGTGKTQLAFKYAAIHASDYPGGCFYIPAENATNWDEALQDLIAPRVSTLGISTLECLGLKNTSDNDKPNQGKQQRQEQKATRTENQNLSSPPIQFASSDIVNALVRRSRDVGKVLILLDNVEKPAAFFSNENLTKAFPADLADIAFIATSRTTKGINQRAAFIEKLPLGDLSQTAAIELLCGPKSFSTDEERSAAESIVRILECRALYVRRVAMLVEDTRRPYSRLYNKLLADKLLVVQPQEDEEDLRAPEVIWNWTREHLAKSLNGAIDIQLAQTIALFPADGVADRILESLWYSNFGELGAKETLDAYREDPDLFVDALKRLSEYSLIQYTPEEHIVRMHRLDRAAIQKALKDTQSNWQDRIGTALRACLCFSPSDWVELGNAHSPLLDYCPWESIGESNATKILAENPELRDNPALQWNEFDDVTWWQLLLKQPDFIDLPQCKPVFLTPLLAKDPKLRGRFNLSDFTGRWWAILLSNDPSLTAQCPWNRLKKNDWLLLLSHRPEMLCYCQHKGILNAKGNLEYRGDAGFHDYYIWDKTSYWGKLLSAQPQFAQMCQWGNLSPQDCISILKSAPHFATSCPAHTLRLLTGEEWTDIIKTSPQVWNENVYPADAFPRKAYYSMTCRNYGDDLFPENLDYGLHWADVLKANPNAQTVCPFAKLSPAEWCELLLLDRTLCSENPPWEAIANLLTERDLWHNTHGFDLYFNPTPLGERLEFTKLAPFRPPKPIKDPILDAAPPLPDHRQNELIERIRNEANLTDICSCDLMALENFQCHNILSKQPQLASLCPPVQNETTVHSSVDAEEFQFLLTIPRGLDFSSEFVLEHEDASWTEKISAAEKAITHFANTPHSLPPPSSCNQSRAAGAIFAIAASAGSQISADFPWDKLDGDMLCLILVNRPSLKDHCDFSKFSGRDWAVLLSENPEFEDICDWSKLDESDWTYLLNDRPWFIEHKPS